jgi:Uma2 family endonuclease
MPMVADKTSMSLEEFLALPDDGPDCDLIRGTVRVWGVPGENPHLRRDRFRAGALTGIGHVLGDWCDERPGEFGSVYIGRVGCILRRTPATFVAIDLAYLSPGQLAQQGNSEWIDGPPTLAVEIAALAKRQEEIDTRVLACLGAGVRVVWLVNPTFRTVTVFCPDAEPVLFNVHDELTAEPHLPGFRAAVADLFRP